jgi:hypothetical protein
MAWRSRIAAFGSAAVLLIAGALCTALIGGNAGQIVGLALMGTGAIVATGLVFLEVGLSEDHERAREREAMLKRAKRGRRPLGLKRSRLGQSRGHRRRLG